MSDPDRGVRLQRFLADAGIASRRACEKLIEDGRVEVNGTPVIELPVFVDPEQDRIRVDGKVIGNAERQLYIMLNKPSHTLSTVMDEPGAERRTVLDLVEHPSHVRLFPVGRLDYDTLGLILLTNDGELANRLTHPRYGVPKTYHAVVKGRLEDEDCERLEKGIYLAERKAGKTVGAVRTSHVGVSIFRRDRERTILEVTLREGRNRQVRRMLAQVGCPVKKLERIAMGPLRLKGLARGEWRELTAREIRALRKAANAAARGSSGSGTGSRGGKKTPSRRGGSPRGGPTRRSDR
ncbi:MAG: pseudouridine synthase [Planctomycetota bacterium]